MTNEELFKRYHLSTTKMYTPFTLLEYCKYILHLNKELLIETRKERTEN